MNEMIKALIPIVASRRECKTKISFMDRLDAVPLPKEFVLPQFTQFGGSGDPIKHLQRFLAKMKITSNYSDIYAKYIYIYQQTVDALIAKFGSVIQAHQHERAFMDIEQGPTESLKTYHKRYNDILLTIPEVNNNVDYMAFYRGLRYGKLKMTLVLETPLSKDQLTERVKQYVELEELKTKETKGKDLRDVFTSKRARSKSPRKQSMWERIQRDRGQSFKR
ncbi:hypothetical protein LIER_23784 [Lithospermum erythrorhizon]|uniref:Retrotransposon gag domain-containing protein n=1 Tax=Lithospermum erythrorhizon TaxID=34254 RepID=A0AAV3R1V8_LITER